MHERVRNIINRCGLDLGTAGVGTAIVLGFLSRPCCSLLFFLALFGMGSASLVELLLPYCHLFLAISAISFSISG